MSVETIINDIRAVRSPEEMREIIDAVNLQMTFLTRKNIRNFVIGDKAKFTDGHGRTVVGTVTKVNRKTVQVRQSNSGGLFGTLYKVPASILEPA